MAQALEDARINILNTGIGVYLELHLCKQLHKN